MNKRILLFFTLFLIGLMAQSQNNNNNQVIQPGKSTQEQTFFEIQQSYNEYYEHLGVKNGKYEIGGKETKVPGWKLFKRWEWYWEDRVDKQTGTFPIISKADIYTQSRQSAGNRSQNGNWQNLGPISSSGGYSGIGRINCAGFRSGDNSTIYAGAPSGGLWKTIDGGSTWAGLTDYNSVIGVSDVVVVAGTTTSTDVVYIATGDRDGGSLWSLGGGQSNDNNTIGVLKSTDGGVTWLATALTYTASEKKTTNRLLLHPTSNNTLYAATTDGLFKTTDAGATWPLIYSGAEFIDMELKPGTPTTIYGGSMNGKIYRSTDGGLTWLTVHTIIGGYRVELAVSAANPAYVYAVVGSYGGKLNGVYKSTDSGSSFSKVYDGTTAGQYLLGYYCDGSIDGGQSSYSLTIVADPTDANTIFLGGVNTWKSTNGGSNWSSVNMWTSSGTYNPCGSPVVHADKHFFGFQNGSSIMFEGNDGGLYKTTDGGASWTDLSDGLTISQLYRLGVSQTSSGNIICGLQDNGTKSLSGGAWTDVMGGDGMECAIDYTTVTTQYGELYFGNIYRTTNGWAGRTSISDGLLGDASWVTPFTIDPNINTTLYIGYEDVWKSTDQGNAWSKISNWPGSTLKSLAVAPSNSNYIYAAKSSILYATTNGGSSWTSISSGLPTYSASITYIAVKDDDPQTVWVTFGGYNTYGVYQTTDGGSTWLNISAGLPNIPVMSVVQNKQNTSDVDLYAATDVGVYFKNGTNNWVLYSTGLPNVVVTELEIYYDASPTLSRLRASTFGRGLWETDLFFEAPDAEFYADKAEPAINTMVNFFDTSTNSPTSWSWSFSPTTVTFKNFTSANSHNPQVEFDVSGSYQVTLVATNAHGSSTEVKASYITASNSPSNYNEAYSTHAFAYINHVQFGSINNTSSYTNVGGTDPDDKYYEDYTALSTDVIVGQSYDLTVANPYTNNDIDLGVWIDANRDGDFTDNEQVLCDIDGGGEGIFSITIPINADVGSTRIRIRSKYYGATCLPNGATANGEVEDYTLNVQSASTVWKGTNTNWIDDTNWPNNMVPNASYDVTIPTTPVNGSFPTISVGTNASCNTITLETGVVLIINGNLEVEN